MALNTDPSMSFSDKQEMRRRAQAAAMDAQTPQRQTPPPAPTNLGARTGSAQAVGRVLQTVVHGGANAGVQLGNDLAGGFTDLRNRVTAPFRASDVWLDNVARGAQGLPNNAVPAPDVVSTPTAAPYPDGFAGRNSPAQARAAVAQEQAAAPAAAAAAAAAAPAAAAAAAPAAPAAPVMPVAGNGAALIPGMRRLNTDAGKSGGIYVGVGKDGLPTYTNIPTSDFNKGYIDPNGLHKGANVQQDVISNNGDGGNDTGIGGANANLVARSLGARHQNAAALGADMSATGQTAYGNNSLQRGNYTLKDQNGKDTQGTPVDTGPAGIAQMEDPRQVQSYTEALARAMPGVKDPQEQAANNILLSSLKARSFDLAAKSAGAAGAGGGLSQDNQVKLAIANGARQDAAAAAAAKVTADKAKALTADDSALRDKFNDNTGKYTPDQKAQMGFDQLPAKMTDADLDSPKVKAAISFFDSQITPAGGGGGPYSVADLGDFTGDNFSIKRPNSITGSTNRAVLNPWAAAIGSVVGSADSAPGADTTGINTNRFPNTWTVPRNLNKLQQLAALMKARRDAAAKANK